MLLNDIYIYLRSISTTGFLLDDVLKEWFINAKNTKEKIVTLYFVLELVLQKWTDISFGYILSEYFAGALYNKKYSNNYNIPTFELIANAKIKRCMGEPIKLRPQYITTMNIGKLSKKLNNEKLKDTENWNNLHYLLKDEILGKDIIIGNTDTGIAWISYKNRCFDLLRYWDDVYKYLGLQNIEMPCVTLFLEIPDNISMHRPTIFDGGFTDYWVPCTDANNFGRTRQTNSDRAGAPEAVIETNSCRIIDYIVYNQSVKKNNNPFDEKRYLIKLLKILKKHSIKAYDEILRAWGN